MTLILDCTLRDGGYVNNWSFSKQQVADTYIACRDSGVEFCEIGFRRSITDPLFGLWYNATETIIHDTLGDVASEKCKIAIMAQMGTFTMADFVPKKESLISMVRVLVAYHSRDNDDSVLDIGLIQETCDVVSSLRQLGYITAVNIGRIDKVSQDQLVTICQMMSTCEPDYLYLADTYGNLDSIKALRIIRAIQDVYKGDIGFHAHDNLLNASEKTIHCIHNGCAIVDATIGGLGRGAGNARTELLIIHFLVNGTKTYTLYPILEYCEKWISSYKDNHILYFITGMYSIHVNYAIQLLTRYTLSFEDAYKVLMELVRLEKHHFFDQNALHTLCYNQANHRHIMIPHTQTS